LVKFKMPSIQTLLSDKNDTVNYKEIIDKFSWIVTENQKCILSPDSDGLLCGLLMTHYLNWKVVGFYDGKVMLLNKDFKAKDCIFLDMEIYRKEIRSMGHHMLLVNKNHIPSDWNKNLNNCLQPNLLRNYDKNKDFRLKYPLATVHMLIGIISQKKKINIPESAICPLFFTDGTFNVLFKYPENVLNWLEYLKAGNPGPLKELFENEKYSVYNLIKSMDAFFRRRDEINIHNERGDRLRISETDGSPYNIEKTVESNVKIVEEAKKRILKFLEVLSDTTTWEFEKEKWQCWNDLKLYQFTKGSFQGDKKNVTAKNFLEFMKKKPLSWAITSGQNLEYTIESPDKMVN